MIRVMVVEDDRTSRFLLTRILVGAGYEVIEAEAPAQALNLLNAPEIPDVIISDILMPGMDGLEFSERVKSNPRTKGIPIILCTSVHEKETVVRAGQLGIYNYILKPLSAQKILLEVEKVLLEEVRALDAPDH